MTKCISCKNTVTKAQIREELFDQCVDCHRYIHANTQFSVWEDSGLPEPKYYCDGAFFSFDGKPRCKSCMYKEQERLGLKD